MLVSKSRILINSKTEDDQPILENVFHLLEHNGSTHLDKFVLTLLGWCEESSLDTLLNLLVRPANKQLKKWDEEVHYLIQRFVRSVIRFCYGHFAFTRGKWNFTWFEFFYFFFNF